MRNYRPRLADRDLERRLDYIGAVLIEGPKACGKTATATQHAKTVFRVDDDETVQSLVRLAPERLFDNETPILFDEWQVEPAIWNKVRRQVDDRGRNGLFILTGSATPADDASRHSGAGRFSVMQMRPMSLLESGRDRRVAIPSLGSRRSPENLRRLLQALGRSVGQASKAVDLAKDVGGAGGPIAKETLAAYLEALGRLHLLDNSEAWLPHMRSRARLHLRPAQKRAGGLMARLEWQ
ncbi:ATP-binding protein [Nocardioides sp. Bht2]|uniref:ATP-binding protein n=1 Tax=Nocardioides sp. Bht2 TaxID=3392297 RepID=UPI0039B5BEBE